MWQNKVVVLLVSASVLAGCKKESEPAHLSSPATAPSSSIPATQQLLAGPRIKLNLKYIPFALEVPSTWEVKTFNDGQSVVLEGPTPTDFVSVSMPVERTLTQDQEKALEKQAEQHAMQLGGLTRPSPVRDVSGVKIIEQITLDMPGNGAVSRVTTEPLETLQWTFTLCVPNAKQRTAYELRFVGMTTRQYQNDQAFLRSIIGTVTYNPPVFDPAVK